LLCCTCSPTNFKLTSWVCKYSTTEVEWKKKKTKIKKSKKKKKGGGRGEKKKKKIIFNNRVCRSRTLVVLNNYTLYGADIIWEQQVVCVWCVQWNNVKTRWIKAKKKLLIIISCARDYNMSHCLWPVVLLRSRQKYCTVLDL